jgi:hypothetical protein
LAQFEAEPVLSKNLSLSLFFSLFPISLSYSISLFSLSFFSLSFFFPLSFLSLFLTLSFSLSLSLSLCQSVSLYVCLFSTQNSCSVVYAYVCAVAYETISTTMFGFSMPQIMASITSMNLADFALLNP